MYCSRKWHRVRSQTINLFLCFFSFCFTLLLNLSFNNSFKCLIYLRKHNSWLKNIKINTSRAYTQSNQQQKQRWNPQVCNRPAIQTSDGNRGETPRCATGLMCKPARETEVKPPGVQKDCCASSLEGQTLLFQCILWMGMPMSAVWTDES